MARSDKKPKAPKVKKRRLFGRLREAYKLSKVGDPMLGAWLIAAFIVGTALGVAFFVLLPPDWLVFDLLSSLMVGLLVMMIVFSRRAQKSQINQIYGKPGAPLAVLQVLKRGWRTDQMVAVNKQQDMVHRLIGPPGIILIAEGNRGRVKPMLSAEVKRHQRVAAEAPLHPIVVGEEAGEVPLGKLVKRVRKMKRELKPAEMTDVLNRLKAIDAARPVLPMPKGPIPTSTKGMRGQMRGR